MARSVYGLSLLILVACGAPISEQCPERPSHIEGGTMQCVWDGCALGDLRWSALRCETQMGQWEPSDDCSFRASFLCANGLSAGVVYTNDDRALFTVRGDGCESHYVLAVDSVACE